MAAKVENFADFFRRSCKENAFNSDQFLNWCPDGCDQIAQTRVLLIIMARIQEEPSDTNG